jgi:hypothetical protein
MSKPNIKKETQLTLELQEPLSNRFVQFKSNIIQYLRVFEIMKFSRSWALWFSLIFSGTLIFLQFYFLFTKFSTLPTIVPALKMYTTLEKTLIQRDFLFAYPLGSILMIITSIYISSITHLKNNIVALTLLVLTTFSIAGITYSLIVLMSIYNV